MVDRVLGHRVVATLDLWGPDDGGLASLVVEGCRSFLFAFPAVLAGLDETPPDYGETDQVGLGDRLAGWDSEIVLLQATFLDRG